MLEFIKLCICATVAILVGTAIGDLLFYVLPQAWFSLF